MVPQRSNEKQARNHVLVSVVILTYNGLDHVKTCLESVLQTSYSPIEAIVVDNGSTDGTVQYLRQRFPSVNVVELNTNTGPATGFMAGVRHSKGDYVVLLSNDMEVESSWLGYLVDALQEDPSVAAAEPKYKDFYDRRRFDVTAAAGRWIDRFGNNFTRGVGEIDVGQYDEKADVIGVATMFRRREMLRVGGYDASYFFGYEDMDVGWRFYLAGDKVVYVPESVIYHKSGASSRSSKGGLLRPALYYLNKRNRLISIMKNYSVKNMLTALGITELEFLGTSLYQGYSGNKEHMIALQKAMRFPITGCRQIMMSRSRVQRMRRRSDKAIMAFMVGYNGDILKILRGMSQKKTGYTD